MAEIKEDNDRLAKLPKKTYEVITNIIKFINKQDEINSGTKK